MIGGRLIAAAVSAVMIGLLTVSISGVFAAGGSHLSQPATNPGHGGHLSQPGHGGGGGGHGGHASKPGHGGGGGGHRSPPGHGGHVSKTGHG